MDAAHQLTSDVARGRRSRVVLVSSIFFGAQKMQKKAARDKDFCNSR
jgi:hypothetical protein